MSSPIEKIDQPENETPNEKKTWTEPEFSKLKAEETATGAGAFDEDADLKAGS